MPCPSHDWKSYALGEMDSNARREADTHLMSCSNCQEELSTVRLTLDSLSTLREEEVPRRIAFVSDKVFEPRWWQRVLNPTFAAGALVAAAILIHGSLRPGQSQVDAAVTSAIAQIEARHTQELQVVYQMLDMRDKQVANMYRNVVLSQ